MVKVLQLVELGEKCGPTNRVPKSRVARPLIVESVGLSLPIPIDPPQNLRVFTTGDFALFLFAQS